MDSERPDIKARLTEALNELPAAPADRAMDIHLRLLADEASEAIRGMKDVRLAAMQSGHRIVSTARASDSPSGENSGSLPFWS